MSEKEAVHPFLDRQCLGTESKRRGETVLLGLQTPRSTDLLAQQGAASLGPRLLSRLGLLLCIGAASPVSPRGLALYRQASDIFFLLACPLRRSPRSGGFAHRPQRYLRLAPGSPRPSLPALVTCGFRKSDPTAPGSLVASQAWPPYAGPPAASNHPRSTTS